MPNDACQVQLPVADRPRGIHILLVKLRRRSICGHILVNDVDRQRIDEAIDKVDKALEHLRICKETGSGHHPRIEKAIDALDAAKDELKD